MFHTLLRYYNEVTLNWESLVFTKAVCHTLNMKTKKKGLTIEVDSPKLLKVTKIYNIMYLFLVGSAIYGFITGGSNAFSESSRYFTSLISWDTTLPFLSFFNLILLFLLLKKESLKGNWKRGVIVLILLCFYFILNVALGLLVAKQPFFDFLRVLPLM